MCPPGLSLLYVVPEEKQLFLTALRRKGSLPRGRRNRNSRVLHLQERTHAHKRPDLSISSLEPGSLPQTHSGPVPLRWGAQSHAKVKITPKKYSP